MIEFSTGTRLEKDECVREINGRMKVTISNLQETSWVVGVSLHEGLNTD